MTIQAARGDNEHVPCVIYTIDEKMGQTYIHEDMANTLAARDYKQPQAVVRCEDVISEDCRLSDSKDV